MRASGPGGQNVNKVSTAVQLRTTSDDRSLPADVRERLRALAGSRMTDEDVLVIDARTNRTQVQNREEARERLGGVHTARAHPAETPAEDPSNQGGERTAAGLEEATRRHERGRGPAATSSAATGGGSQIHGGDVVNDLLGDMRRDLVLRRRRLAPSRP